MTPATYAKGGAGAQIDFTTVDSDYGRVLVAATRKGIAAVFLGDNDRALEKSLHTDFPAAEITRNDRALGPRVKSVLSRLYGRKPTALDAPDVPFDIVGTAFQWKVWKALTEIPAGETRTYGEMAQDLGDAGLARAVGQALGHNPFAPVVPCHRVLAAGARSGGFSARGGVATKLRMLQIEGAQIGGEPGLFDGDGA